jgi:hypothetical protein
MTSVPDPARRRLHDQPPEHGLGSEEPVSVPTLLKETADAYPEASVAGLSVIKNRKWIAKIVSERYEFYCDICIYVCINQFC